LNAKLIVVFITLFSAFH